MEGKIGITSGTAETSNCLFHLKNVDWIVKLRIIPVHRGQLVYKS